MRIIKALVLVLLIKAIAPSKVLADPIQVPLPKGQWQSILNDGNGTNVAIDQGSIARQGDVTAFWLKLNSVKSANVANMYFAANCSTGANMPLWKVLADRQGRILQSVKVNQQATAAQGFDWQILNVVCGNQNPALQAQAYQAEIVKAQLEALSRARQTNAEMITNVLNSTASMFK